MKPSSKQPHPSEERISSAEFLKSYNKNMPEGFLRASETTLQEFKDEHPSFFKHGNLWSLDEHRKRLIDWFQMRRAKS